MLSYNVIEHKQFCLCLSPWINSPSASTRRCIRVFRWSKQFSRSPSDSCLRTPVVLFCAPDRINTCSVEHRFDLRKKEQVTRCLIRWIGRVIEHCDLFLGHKTASRRARWENETIISQLWSLFFRLCLAVFLQPVWNSVDSLFTPKVYPSCQRKQSSWPWIWTCSVVLSASLVPMLFSNAAVLEDPSFIACNCCC